VWEKSLRKSVEADHAPPALDALPRRIHNVVDRHASEQPVHPALIENGVWSYKRPSEIIVLPTLPATSTGKILKHRLAESLRRP
jgi:non-ribosomal peptide synthetase component E (peptide arylation enzyme)